LGFGFGLGCGCGLGFGLGEYVGDEAGGVVPAPAVAAVANIATTSARTATSEAITRPRRAMAKRLGMHVLSGPVVQ
jgi:hypothetical protein